MQTFTMMMGMCGCGKSTKSAEIADDNTVILSSDAIRKELGVAPDRVGRTFDVLHRRVRENLRAGKNVIYDATNMSRKNRLAALRIVGQSHTNCRKILYCFLVPLGVCKSRNAQRKGVAKVPDYVFLHMMKQFQFPTESEGWDEIFWVREPVVRMTVSLGSMVDFNQDNHHHSLSLFEHCRKSADLVRDIAKENGFGYWTRTNRLLETAALYHDIGKLLTKDFHNARGEVTDEAHYYGHDNVGAYLYATEIGAMTGYQLDDIRVIALLINYHMRAYLVHDKNPDGLATQLDKKILGTSVFDMVQMLHQADKQAH